MMKIIAITKSPLITTLTKVGTVVARTCQEVLQTSKMCFTLLISSSWDEEEPVLRSKKLKKFPAVSLPQIVYPFEVQQLAPASSYQEAMMNINKNLASYNR
jgi:hypothetical protein